MLICFYNKTMNGSSYALTNQSEHLLRTFEYVEHKNIEKISEFGSFCVILVELMTITVSFHNGY